MTSGTSYFRLGTGKIEPVKENEKGDRSLHRRAGFGHLHLCDLWRLRQKYKGNLKARLNDTIANCN
jgi:hypothetical protein